MATNENITIQQAQLIAFEEEARQSQQPDEVPVIRLCAIAVAVGADRWFSNGILLTYLEPASNKTVETQKLQDLSQKRQNLYLASEPFIFSFFR